MKPIPLLAFGTLFTLGALCLVPRFATSAAAGTGWDPKQVKLVGSAIASIVLGLAALAIIALKKDEADKKWAYGMIGTIAGYWLPSPVQ